MRVEDKEYIHEKVTLSLSLEISKQKEKRRRRVCISNSLVSDKNVTFGAFFLYTSPQWHD